MTLPIVEVPGGMPVTLSASSGTPLVEVAADIARGVPVQLCADRGMPVQLAPGGELYGFDTLRSDYGFYSKGSYFAFSSPWGTGGFNPPLLQGRDYADFIRINSTDFPANSRIDWRMPTSVDPVAVWGYMHLGWGNYDNSTVTPPVTPLALSAIATCTSAIDWTANGSVNWNLLHECYLTTTAHQTGVLSDKQAEVGIMPYAPPDTIAFHNSGTNYGTWDGGAHNWTVRGHPVNTSWTGTYFTVLPADGLPVMQDALNWKSLFNHLIANASLSSALYVNGFALGIEPTAGGGTGSLTILDWQMAMAAA